MEWEKTVTVLEGNASMARLAGVDLPREKRMELSLIHI